MQRRRERRGCARCSELFASGCTFFSLMIEELGDLYAFPRTVITPPPQVKLDSMSLRKCCKETLYSCDSCCCQFPEDPDGSVPEQDTSASTNLFYCEPSKSSSLFFVFHEVGERDQKVGESRGQRDKKCLRESQRPPLCTSKFYGVSVEARPRTTPQFPFSPSFLHSNGVNKL